MKITYIVTRLDEFGGVQIHIRDMALWMRAQGHEVHVLSGWPGIISDYLVHEGISYTEIPDLVRPIKPAQDVKALQQLKEKLAEIKPDIVSCHSSKAGMHGRLAAKALKIPVIFTAHGWAFTEGVPLREQTMYRWMEKFGGMFSDHIVTVSEHDREIGLKARIVPPEKMTAIHNGMPDIPPPLRKLQEPNDIVKILMVARFCPQKDHETLLRALAGCTQKNWMLQLAGSGDSLHIHKLIEELGLDNRVSILGERSDVDYLLEQADMFCLISHWEGFPRSILEAMRAQLPVITSNVGGSAESVVQGETGYVVARKAVKELSERLDVLLSDPALRLKMGGAGRRLYEEKFRFQIMAEKTFSLYQQVLQACGKV
ncbi:MAG: glycosyltransferase [Alphaproteobacteria bacterium]|nr:glycosyltransferase [Alphaproteobacteria bacterium]